MMWKLHDIQIPVPMYEVLLKHQHILKGAYSLWLRLVWRPERWVATELVRHGHLTLLFGGLQAVVSNKSTAFWVLHDVPCHALLFNYQCGHHVKTEWISNKGWWRMGYFPPELGDNMQYMEAVTLQRIQSLLAFPGKWLVDYYVIQQTANSQESNGWSEKLENLKLNI